MAEFKIIQMYNSTGAEVFPRTMAEIVKYDETSSVKQKIEALVTAGGEPNVLTAVKWNGEAFAITDKAVDIYSKVSTFVSEEIGKQIHMNVEVVEALPETGVKGIIYLIAHTGTGTAAGTGGNYDEYIWTGSAFELIGTTAVDLTGYATEDFVTTAINNKVTDLNLAQYATVEALNAVDKKADDNAAAVKAINESAVMTSGITADKVGAYDAYVAVERYSKTEADAMAEGKASAAITALDLPNTYAAKEATEQHIANNDIHVNAEQVAAIADVANKANSSDVEASFTEVNGKISANEGAINTLNGNVTDLGTNKADKTVAVNGKTLSVLYFEEVTA